jgi:hypothetical protein
MKRTQKLAVGLAASLGLGLAVAAHAHPGRMDGGMRQGMHSGAQHGMQGVMGHGATGAGAPGEHARQQMMTPEEHTAIRDKMRSAATPEERQQIAAAARAEMQKRAQEKGITLPEQRGSRAGAGPNPARGTDAHTH